MDKEQVAIMRIKEASRMSEKYYSAPLVVTTSGGKDSSVCVELALRAGINFEIMHNHTTADAPETVYFIRSEFKRLEENGFPAKQITINYPTYKGVSCSMWTLIPQKLMPPTRLVRYCCSILKEKSGAGRYITTGVRWAESIARKTRGIYEVLGNNISKRVTINNDNDDRRRLFERCELQHKAVCNPIIDWTDDEVWDFIEDAKMPINPLYSSGFSRVGCIGCPMAGKRGREIEFARYPKYREAYERSFDRMLKVRKEKGKPTYNWQTGRDVYHWWMEHEILSGQMEFDDMELEEDTDFFTEGHLHLGYAEEGE